MAENLQQHLLAVVIYECKWRNGLIWNHWFEWSTAHIGHTCGVTLSIGNTIVNNINDVFVGQRHRFWERLLMYTNCWPVLELRRVFTCSYIL
jgi:hypothetical protein